MSAFETGLVIGRFQTFHLGHAEIIQKALDISEKVVVCIGSAQESGTDRNPFPYTLRHQMLETVFTNETTAGRLIIMPLDDIGVGDNSKWGKYVLDEVEKKTGRTPQVIVSGTEIQRVTWFGYQLAELFIPKTIKISASELRDLMVHDLREKWVMYVPKQLVSMYDKLRYMLPEVQNMLSSKLLQKERGF